MDYESEILKFLRYRSGSSTIEEIGSEFNLDPFREVTQICGVLKESGVVSFDGWNVSLLQRKKSKKPEISHPQSETFNQMQEKMLDIISSERRADNYKKMISQGRTFSIIGGICFIIAFGYLFPYGRILFLIFLFHGIVFLIIGNIYLIVGFTHKQR